MSKSRPFTSPDPKDVLFKIMSDLPIPTGPARPGDAGVDLMNTGPDAVIPTLGVVTLDAGFCVKIPEGHFGLIVGRSSTFAKKGLLVPPAVIDSGYVGPIYIVVFNPAVEGKTQPVIVKKGERIAQLIVLPYAEINPIVTNDLPDTERGHGGFGSTG